MDAPVPAELLETAATWDHLHRWERAELGRALRGLGLTYGEIMSLIPVPKGTLAGWCRDIRLTDDQVTAIKARSRSREGVPRDTQWRRREEVERIRVEARTFALDHLGDPFWVAGTVLYWGEGSKTHGTLELANTDPAALRLFIVWTRRYLDGQPDFVLSLHLHEGNDELAARDYWRKALDLDDVAFHKTYFKPAGTGHQKNHLPHGICRVRLRRSTDAWLRAIEWIVVAGSALIADQRPG